MFKIAALAFVCLLLPQALGDENKIPSDDNIYDNFRLPTAVIPENYKLEVITDLNDTAGFLFRGHVWITMNVKAFADNITLHSKGLKIATEEIKLYELQGNSTVEDLKKNEKDYSKDERKIRKTHFVTKFDFMVIYPLNILSKFRKYAVKIPFEGVLHSSLHAYGFKRRSYFDKKAGKKIWLAVTHFEPIHARNAFPCFDEPEMKATFDVSIGHHKKYTSISNMPQKDSKKMEKLENFVIDTFDTSVPMSTYLVAYCVSDFEYKEATVSNKKDDVKFRIYARRDAMDQVDYAADVGPKVLKFYEEYFKIKFSLPKIDMIAIPDFAAGLEAMENWGLITSFESGLLLHANSSTLSSKHHVCGVIAHELAHQWFGNLVTMKWWNDVWLNEGFATYVESLGVAHLHPEWKSLDADSVEKTLTVFNFDAHKSSHPVSFKIANPDQISIAQIFDDIVYFKGSVIIRMMHWFLGDKAFQDGVSNYLMKHKYANAKQDDLWAALTDVAHSNQVLPPEMTVKEIMDTWTLQVGYPIIEVRRDYDTNTAHISQMRYLSDRYKTRDDTDHCWWVPLTYTNSEQNNFAPSHAHDWLACATDKSPITKRIENLPDEKSWVIFNIQLAGLYKVKYDRRNYKLIIKTLNSDKFKSIHTINRAQLIDDAMDLAWHGEQDYGVALEMMNYLSQEDEYIPWQVALHNLGLVDRLILRSPIYGVFTAYVQHILEPIYKKVGGISGPVTSSRLDAVKHQSVVCWWACGFNVGDCVEKSVEWFANWMAEAEPDHNNPVPLNHRAIVYCTAIRMGREPEWSFLWKRYVNSNVSADKSMIIGSLSCSREQWLLNRYLEWSLNSTLVRKQDFATVFGWVARDSVGFRLAKSFFLDRFDDIYNTVFPDTGQIDSFILPLAEQLSSQRDIRELKDLILNKMKAFEKVPKGVKQALETVELNYQWMVSRYADLSRRLTNLMLRNFDVESSSLDDDEETTKAI